MLADLQLIIRLLSNMDLQFTHTVTICDVIINAITIQISWHMSKYTQYPLWNHEYMTQYHDDCQRCDNVKLDEAADNICTYIICNTKSMKWQKWWLWCMNAQILYWYWRKHQSSIIDWTNQNNIDKIQVMRQWRCRW